MDQPKQYKCGGCQGRGYVLEANRALEQRIAALEVQIQERRNTLHIGIDESIPQMIDNLTECLIKKIREERGEEAWLIKSK